MRRCRKLPPEMRAVLWPLYRRLDLCTRREGHKGPHRSQKRQWDDGARYSIPRPEPAATSAPRPSVGEAGGTKE